MVATDGQTRERNGQERGRTGTANQPGLSSDLKQINPDWPAGRINERSNSRVDSSPGRPVRRDAWKSGDRNRYITPRDQVLGSRRRPRDDRVERGFEPGATFRGDRAGIGLDSGHAGYGLWLIDGNGARDRNQSPLQCIGWCTRQRAQVASEGREPVKEGGLFVGQATPPVLMRAASSVFPAESLRDTSGNVKCFTFEKKI